MCNKEALVIIDFLTSAKLNIYFGASRICWDNLGKASFLPAWQVYFFFKLAFSNGRFARAAQQKIAFGGSSARALSGTPGFMSQLIRFKLKT